VMFQGTYSSSCRCDLSNISGHPMSRVAGLFLIIHCLGLALEASISSNISDHSLSRARLGGFPDFLVSVCIVYVDK